MTSDASPPLDRIRLARMLGMIGSAHDPEALAAARKADALVREAGLTWADVVCTAQGTTDRARAGHADAPLRTPAGRWLRPPLASWLETVFHLIRAAKSGAISVSQVDQQWLAICPLRWQARAINLAEAQKILELYAAAHPAPAPRAAAWPPG